MNEIQAQALRKQIRPNDRIVLSPHRLTQLRAVEQSPSKNVYSKPSGLWYACGDEWLRWVLNEMPDWLEGYKYAYALYPDTTDMLVIRTPDQFDQFTRQYGGLDKGIAWDRVASRYTGIEICPYQWDRRMGYGSSWYYTWDVASGCIWDPAAVRQIEPISLGAAAAHSQLGAAPERREQYAVYEETSPLEYPRFGTHAQRFGLIAPDAGPTTESYFAPTERRHRYGKGGRVLKKPRIELIPGARPDTIGWLDWHPLAPGEIFIDFVTVRADWQSRGVGRQLLEAFYAGVVAPRGITYVDWGQLMHPNAERLYRYMRTLYPNVAHRARF